MLQECGRLMHVDFNMNDAAAVDALARALSDYPTTCSHEPLQREMPTMLAARNGHGT